MRKVLHPKRKGEPHGKKIRPLGKVRWGPERVYYKTFLTDGRGRTIISFLILLDEGFLLQTSENNNGLLLH